MSNPFPKTNISVTSGQAVTIQWSISSGTATAGPRILTLMRTS